MGRFQKVPCGFRKGGDTYHGARCRMRKEWLYGRTRHGDYELKNLFTKVVIIICCKYIW